MVVFPGRLPPEQYAAAMAACDGDTARCFWPRQDVHCPPACLAAVIAATANAVDGWVGSRDLNGVWAFSEFLGESSPLASPKNEKAQEKN